MSIKSKFLNFFKILFPSTFVELGIFIFFLSVYGILGSYIAVNYRIIFDSRIPWDAYFSFDNKAIVTTGGSFERHPLSYYFFNWMKDSILIFTNGKTDVNFRLILAWLSNFIISLSLVQVYKYLKNIIRLPLLISLLIVFFFSLFSTNILLSFTPETYGRISAQLAKAGTPIPQNDIWIAALALQFDLPLATSDSHFEYVPGLEVLLW